MIMSNGDRVAGSPLLMIMGWGDAALRERIAGRLANPC
jgi:hypothetical protein